MRRRLRVFAIGGYLSYRALFGWQQPALFVIILLRFIFMFTKFDLIYLFAGAGGLGYFVRTLPIYAFVKSFGEYQVGAGSALSVIMFMILVAFAFVYFRSFKRDE